MQTAAEAIAQDAATRLARLEACGERKILGNLRALGDRTIAEALEAGDMWELIDRVLNRHEEGLHHELLTYAAVIVGESDNRFLVFEHAVLGSRASGPMPVGALMRVVDSASQLLLSGPDVAQPEVWRVEPGPDQRVEMGAFAAKRGETVQLSITNGDHRLSLDDLAVPSGRAVEPAVASDIRAIETSIRRNGSAHRNRLELV